MKKKLGVVLVVCALVLSGFASSQNPPPAPAPGEGPVPAEDPAPAPAPVRDPAAGADEAKLARLERDLVESRARTEALAAELVETKTRLANVVRYLEQQAASAQALATTLDASEAAGFTFGINPESRHILLRGWREQLGAVQKDLPAPVVAPPVAKKRGR